MYVTYIAKFKKNGNFAGDTDFLGHKQTNRQMDITTYSLKKPKGRLSENLFLQTRFCSTGFSLELLSAILYF